MKLNNTITFLFFLILSIILWSSCGCTQTTFAPTGARHLPIKEKNDLQLATDFNGVQIGYSPIQHIGIQGSYFNKNRKDNHFEAGTLYYCDRENRVADIALGGYHSFLLKNRKKVQQVLVSGYVGYGQGTFKSYYIDESSYQFNHQFFYQQLGAQYLTPRFQLGYFLKREVNDLEDGQFSFGENPFTPATEFTNIIESDLQKFYSSNLKATFELEVIWLFANVTWHHSNQSFNAYPARSIQGGFAIDINDIYKKFIRKK